MSYHLGKEIENRLQELGMTKAEFGRRISTSRQNVSLLLKKNAMSTDLLVKICETLNFNFFAGLYDGPGKRAKRKVWVSFEVDSDDLPDSFYEKNPRS